MTPYVKRELEDVTLLNERYGRYCTGLWILGAILVGIGWALDAEELMCSVAMLLGIVHKTAQPLIHHHFFPRTATAKVAFWMLLTCVVILFGTLLLCAHHKRHTAEPFPPTATPISTETLNIPRFTH